MTVKQVLLAATCAYAALSGIAHGWAQVRARRVTADLDALGPPPAAWWARAVWSAGAAFPWLPGAISGAVLAGVFWALFGGPSLVRSPLGGSWFKLFAFWLPGMMWALALAEAWRVTRARFPVAALGRPVLKVSHVSPDVTALIAALAPPPLVAPAEVPRSRRELALTAVAGGVMLPVAFVFGPPVAPRLRLAVTAFALAAAVLIVTGLVGAWWKLPRGRGRWLTAEGAVSGVLTVRWEDVGRVALAPVPAAACGRHVPAGSLALEVAAGNRWARFLVPPESRAAFDRLLAAVPRGRVVYAAGLAPPDPPAPPRPIPPRA